MGTKQTISTNPVTGTDALFRSWGSAHSAALAAAGLVQTSDTGQINWVTVLKPAASAFGGYEIWRFADTLQATAPIFLKIEYGIGAAVAATSAAIRVSIGTSTNGAGTLGGVTQVLDAAPNLGSASNSNTNAVSPSYICHPAAGGSLTMVFNAGGLTSPPAAPVAALVLDRTRDAAGAPTGVGATALWVRNITTTATFVAMYGFNFSTPGTVAASVPISAVPDATTMSGAGNFVCARQYGRIPTLVNVAAALTYLNAEALALSEFDVAPIGATSRHFLCLGSANAGNAASNQSNASANAATTNEGIAALAVLWEN
jgi:hypothetical protein